MNDEAPEYPNLSHDEEFYDASNMIKGDWEPFAIDAIHRAAVAGISVGEYAQLQMAREMEVISYSLWHIAKSAEPKRRDLVAEFGPFAKRYIARHGEVSEEEMRALFEDFQGIELRTDEPNS